MVASISNMLSSTVITLLGCGTWQNDGGAIHIALTFGLTVTTVVWVFGHISGGHVNPAVTTAALFTRRVSIIR